MSELRAQIAGMNGDAGLPGVSIIVPTRNRVSKLARCLEHISAIRGDTPWELIVVDNGSSDETPQFLDDFANRSPIPLKVVKEPAAGGMRSRNAGAEAARGEVLIFIDNDCYLSRTSSINTPAFFGIGGSDSQAVESFPMYEWKTSAMEGRWLSWSPRSKSATQPGSWCRAVSYRAATWHCAGEP
jgi:glycosyltransferase involved in cell wall biosynthesis